MAQRILVRMNKGEDLDKGVINHPKNTWILDVINNNEEGEL